jgi:hypothetical protein
MTVLPGSKGFSVIGYNSNRPTPKLEVVYHTENTLLRGTDSGEASCNNIPNRTYTKLQVAYTINFRSLLYLPHLLNTEMVVVVRYGA